MIYGCLDSLLGWDAPGGSMWAGRTGVWHCKSFSRHAPISIMHLLAAAAAMSNKELYVVQMDGYLFRNTTSALQVRSSSSLGTWLYYKIETHVRAPFRKLSKVPVPGSGTCNFECLTTNAIVLMHFYDVRLSWWRERVPGPESLGHRISQYLFVNKYGKDCLPNNLRNASHGTDFASHVCDDVWDYPSNKSRCLIEERDEIS